jgi:PIN domain nuclease of toxin-antitoxin system
MSVIVFDASVIIAMLQEESGHQEGLKWIEQALVSTVNIAEVASFLSMKTLPLLSIRQTIARLAFNIIPLTTELAELTGALRYQTRSAGLSLGDRACLALAISREIPVLTADKAWAKLDLPIEVKLIR